MPIFTVNVDFVCTYEMHIQARDINDAAKISCEMNLSKIPFEKEIVDVGEGKVVAICKQDDYITSEDLPIENPGPSNPFLLLEEKSNCKCPNCNSH